MTSQLPRNWPNEYWGNILEGQAPAQRQAAGHRPNAAVARINEIRAQQDAERRAILDSINSKIVRANVVGVPDKSLIPMAELAKAGFSAERTPEGIPYGIDPHSLTADERAFLGLPQPEPLPTAAITPQQQAMVAEMMRRRSGGA